MIKISEPQTHMPADTTLRTIPTLVTSVSKNHLGKPLEVKLDRNFDSVASFHQNSMENSHFISKSHFYGCNVMKILGPQTHMPVTTTLRTISTLVTSV